MNKAHLIEAVAAKLGDRSLAALAVEAVFDTVVRAVAGGQTVAVTGFGTLLPVQRQARPARNPHTGESMMLPEATVPAFRPGANFKALVAGTKALPVEGSAVKKAPKTSRKAS